MKCQIFIGEVEKLHHDRGPGYLLGAHPISTGSVTFYLQITVEILQNMIVNGRSIVKDVADHLQLYFFGMTCGKIDQRHLFLCFCCFSRILC